MKKIQIINKYNEVKANYSKFLILIKKGIVYKTLNDDAYIMNYLFNYEIKELSNNSIVEFPQRLIKEVINRLKKENISYVIFDDNSRLVSNKNICMEGNYDKLLVVSKNL